MITLKERVAFLKFQIKIQIKEELRCYNVQVIFKGALYVAEIGLIEQWIMKLSFIFLQDWPFINPNSKVLGGIIFLAQMKFNMLQYVAQLSLMLWFEKRDGHFLNYSNILSLAETQRHLSRKNY